MNALKAICAVSAELAKDGISKERNNQQQGYKFRGIDDCLNALAPLMASHGLVIIPECLERTVTERETRNGGQLFYVVVRVKYRFYSTEDGSTVDAYVFGEAMDAADKATNKAMSAAYKYAVIQTFCIPTEGDNDADATPHEVKAQRYTQTKQANAQKIAELREQVAPRPFNPEVCPTDEGVSDQHFAEFRVYVGDSPERTAIGKKMKAKMSIGDLDLLAPIGRKAFMLSVQDEAKRQGVPFSEWVKE